MIVDGTSVDAMMMPKNFGFVISRKSEGKHRKQGGENARLITGTECVEGVSDLKLILRILGTDTFDY